MTNDTDTITADDAASIRARVNAFEEWRSGRTSWHEGEVPGHVPQVANVLRGLLEKHEALRDLPKQLFVYVKQAGSSGPCTVTTWTGHILGHGHIGSPYRAGFGGATRQSLEVTIGGKRYTGTAYTSSGDYARITRRN